MPSAPQAVRAAARYVAPPLGDEGAAELIERLVLVSPETAARNAAALAAEHAADHAAVEPLSEQNDASDVANDEADAEQGPGEPGPALIGASRA